MLISAFYHPQTKPPLRQPGSCRSRKKVTNSRTTPLFSLTTFETRRNCSLKYLGIFYHVILMAENVVFHFKMLEYVIRIFLLMHEVNHVTWREYFYRVKSLLKYLLLISDIEARNHFLSFLSLKVGYNVMQEPIIGSWCNVHVIISVKFAQYKLIGEFEFFLGGKFGIEWLS